MQSYRKRYIRAARAASIGGGSRTTAEKVEADRKYEVVNSTIKLNAEGTKHPTRQGDK